MGRISEWKFSKTRGGGGQHRPSHGAVSNSGVPHGQPSDAARGEERVYCGVQGVRIRGPTLTLALNGVGKWVVVFILFLLRCNFLCCYSVFTRNVSEAGVLFTEDKVKCESRPCLCGLAGLSPHWIVALPHEQMGTSRQATTEQAWAFQCYLPVLPTRSACFSMFPRSCLPGRR